MQPLSKCSLVLAALLGFLATGCGDVECGEGTTLRDGKCVDDDPAPRCGEGTELVDGRCVSTTGTVSCGEGTKLVAGECVVESPVDCGEGTELVDGSCLPECAEDETRVDGVCRPNCDEAGSPFGGGDGTWKSPYRICTVEHLLEVRNHLHADFVLARSIEVDVANFEPIADAAGEGLRGRFDGAGLELRGLKIQRPEEDLVGLFRRIESGGGVLSLGLVDVTIEGKSETGAIAGYNMGTILDSYVGAHVEGTTMVGGLVGFSTGWILGSHAEGTVSGSTEVGGLVGTNRGSVVDSYARAVVSGSSSIGGLVGHLEGGGVFGSSAMGAVQATGDRVGGGVGLNEGFVVDASATGAVSGRSNVGGLAGESWGTIQGSYATGKVAATEDSVGGLVGYSNYPIARSYATGAVMGRSKVGGLVGLNRRHIEHSYATGAVAGTSETGGLVGAHVGETDLVESSYFLDPGDASNPSALGNPLPREAFGKMESFPGWDFEGAWVMEAFAAPDFARPTLRKNPEKR